MADESKPRIWVPALLIIASVWFFVDALSWSGEVRWDRLAFGVFFISVGVRMLRRAMKGEFMWSDTGDDGDDEWDANGD